LIFSKTKQTQPPKKLTALEDDNMPFGIPAVCCQEILQGARDKREWTLLHDYLISQEILVPNDALTTHINAAELFYKCRKKGIHN